MLTLLADLADKYTESPDPTPEVTVYHFINRLALRALGRH